MTAAPPARRCTGRQIRRRAATLYTYTSWSTPWTSSGRQLSSTCGAPIARPGSSEAVQPYRSHPPTDRHSPHLPEDPGLPPCTTSRRLGAGAASVRSGMAARPPQRAATSGKITGKRACRGRSPVSNSWYLRGGTPVYHGGIPIREYSNRGVFSDRRPPEPKVRGSNPLGDTYLRNCTIAAPQA